MVGTKTAQREVLPKDVVPLHYALHLDPDLDQFVYTGTVAIDVEFAAAATDVTLNGNYLTINSAALDTLEAESIVEDKEKQTFTFKFGKTMEAGSKHTLKVSFSGELNDQMCGFYRSIYKNKSGNESVIACTQMEATDCRRAFPCFDEPALKATFDISITTSEKFLVLSNSSVKTTKSDGSGKTTTTFNTTPKMSTYLVAFVVAELSYVESTLFRLPVRVYAPPGLENGCQYAADVAAKTLAFFEKEFNLQYPLPKLDMVALPDFSSNAMENWGLITFRLTAVNFTEGEDSLDSKIFVTYVVQHELAHQWFGNLVTMEWWEGLWLNEGFATWMGWYACNALYPEWKVWEKYLMGSYHACLTMDALETTHPVEVPIARAQDVDEIFDAISYSKGCSVIRMVSTLLGEETFLKGISHYLHKHQYGNTITTDLWEALTEVSGVKMGDFMSPWTKDPGYPLLTVAETSKRDEISVSQRRFFGAVPQDSVQVYPVSLEIRNIDGTIDRSQVLKELKGTAKVQDTSFVKLNADQTGIFRVKYSDSLLERLTLEGAKGEGSLLSTSDRIGLLGDLEALKGFEVSVGQVLTVARKWSADPSPIVLTKILDILGGVAHVLHFQSETVQQDFRLFRASFVEPLIEKYGYLTTNTEDPLLGKLKTTLFDSALAVESPKYVQIALDLYSAHKFAVPADLRPYIFRAVAKFGTSENWEELKAHYFEGNHPESGTAALQALGFTRDLNHTKQLLTMVLDTTIRKQDARHALMGTFSSSTASAELTWNWYTSNWETIVSKFPVSGRILGNLVSISVTEINTKEHITEVGRFYADKQLSGMERIYANAYDILAGDVAVIESTVKQVAEFLSSNKAI